MQNKANFGKDQMSANSILTKAYGKNDVFTVPENKANSKPISSSDAPAAEGAEIKKGRKP